jgi:hypothetical protein
MPYATSTFTVDGWDEEPLGAADGVELARARVTKTLTGEIEGTSVTEILITKAREGSAAYVGVERIDGRVGGRGGTFVIQHAAMADRGNQSGTWTVVPDSGTGELTALRGEAVVAVDAHGTHTLALDYTLE